MQSLILKRILLILLVPKMNLPTSKGSEVVAKSTNKDITSAPVFDDEYLNDAALDSEDKSPDGIEITATATNQESMISDQL